jgi:hypothetical protein
LPFILPIRKTLPISNLQIEPEDWRELLIFPTVLLPTFCGTPGIRDVIAFRLWH